MKKRNTYQRTLDIMEALAFVALFIVTCAMYQNLKSYKELVSTPIERTSLDEYLEPIVIVEPKTEHITMEPAPVEIVEPKPTPEPEPAEPIEAEEPEPVSMIPDYAAELIGRTIWGEAGGIRNTAERAAVAWCILNRVDAQHITIREAVTAKGQFQGYRPADKWGECPQEHIDLAMDVLQRWEAEKNGAADVGRVLPAEYLFFMGDGRHNHFTVEYKGTEVWDWSLTSPY